MGAYGLVDDHAPQSAEVEGIEGDPVGLGLSTGLLGCGEEGLECSGGVRIVLNRGIDWHYNLLVPILIPHRFCFDFLGCRGGGIREGGGFLSSYLK